MDTEPSAKALIVFCEQRAEEVKSLQRDIVSNAAKMGAIFEEVRALIDTSTWLTWLDKHFGYTDEWARRYRKIHEYSLVEPRILGFQSVELAFKFPSLPEKTQQEIMDKGVTRYSEAQRIIDRHHKQAWAKDIEKLVEEDPGKAMFLIENALNQEPLRDVAVAEMRKHAEKFALLSDRTPREIMAEAGLTDDEKYLPKKNHFVAKLEEDDFGNHYITANGAKLVTFHRQDIIVNGAHRNAIMRMVCQKLGIWE